MNRARTCLFFLPLVLAARLVCAQGNPPPGPAAPAAARAQLQYGLRRRPARQRGRHGAAVSYHAGPSPRPALHPIAPLFFELAVHVSRLTSLGDDSRNASYFEVVAGPRLTW